MCGITLWACDESDQLMLWLDRSSKKYLICIMICHNEVYCIDSRTLRTVLQWCSIVWFQAPIGIFMDRFQWYFNYWHFFLFKICVDGFLRSTYDDNEPMTISETSSSGSEGSLQDMADNGMSSYTMKQSTYFLVNDCFFFLVQLYREAVLCKYNYYSISLMKAFRW